MPCRICGAPCHGDRCADCEQTAANEAHHDVPSDNYDDKEAGDEADSEQWTVEQQGLDGEQHERQATLGGGDIKEVQR